MGLILKGLAGLRAWKPGSSLPPPGKSWLWSKQALGVGGCLRCVKGEGRCLLIYFLSVYLAFCVGFDVWKSCEGKPLRTIEKSFPSVFMLPQNSFLPHDSRPVVSDVGHGSKKKRIRQTLINSNSRKRILTLKE